MSAPRAVWTTTASGRVSFEVPEGSAMLVEWAAHALVRDHGFTAERPIVGGGEVLCTLSRGALTLYVNWDSTSGFYVFGDSAAADAVVRPFGEWVTQQLESPHVRALV